MSQLRDQAREHVSDGGSILLSGPTGIGKSTLLTALAGEFADAGHRLLRCSPSEAEQGLPFLGLIDLLSGIGDEYLDQLPSPERSILKSVLRRSDSPVGEYDVLSLRMAVLDVLRRACAEQPGLLVIDDAQWLDLQTAEVLAFVARRTAGIALSTIAAVGDRRRTETKLCPPPVLELRVPAMTANELTVLFQGHGVPPWTRPMLARIHQVSGGNPFFALELGRALVERGQPFDPAEPMPIPGSLRELMLGRLGGLSAEAEQTLLTMSAAERPTIQLLRRAGCYGAADNVAAAVKEGLVEFGTGDEVRFTDPLLSEVIYSEAAPERRLQTHGVLAEAVTDPVERARHLALIAPGRDPEVAAALSAAAASARYRGALATAARLGQLAADRTPVGDAAASTDRRLTAAEDAVSAGEHALARHIADDVLGRSRLPAERVRAWIVVMDSCGQAMAEVDGVFPSALEDARGDPGLLAQLLYRLSWRAWMVEGSAAKAREHAARSAVLSREAGDRHTEVLALTKQANTEFFLGRPEAEQTLARALEFPRDPKAMLDHNGPVYLKHRQYLLNDRLEDARTELRALMYTVRRRGAAESLCMCLHSLTVIEIHRGRCERALELAGQCLRLAEHSGLSQGPALYAVALAEAAGGRLDRGLAAAEQAQRHSEDDGDVLFQPRALHVEGHIRLLRGETSQAVAALRQVRLLETSQGQADPAMRRWHGDLAEALVGIGCLEEATELIAEGRAQASRLRRRSVLTALTRAAALLMAERGDYDAAVRELQRAAEAFAALAYPLEEGRTRLELGRMQIRRGDAGAARAAFQAARHIFVRTQARPWLDRVSAELELLEAAAPLPPMSSGLLTVLTDVERKVVALVAEGATNREIAARLFVSVKTVEAALTRTYRKLGVRSRVDVARMF
jgi:DNA-binding CsgD family transcriptional regulator